MTKKKLLKATREKWHYHLEGNNNTSVSRFLIRNHGSQKEVAHFSSAEGKELLTSNFVADKIILQK